MTNVSFSQYALREHILPRDELYGAEVQFPGAIRLLLATRRHARLSVKDRAWDFFLNEKSAEEVQFQLEKTTYNNKLTVSPVLWELAWHRAAEAILAVRQGHREFVQNKKYKKVLLDGKT